jgi:hypothetical protein
VLAGADLTPAGADELYDAVAANALAAISGASATVAGTAKFWMSVLAELKNRGVADVLFAVCDGLKGQPDSVEAVFPQTVVQTCVIHPGQEHRPVCHEEVLGRSPRI